MSERIAEVVKIDLKSHPNAEKLSIQNIEGFQVIVNTADWTGKSLGVYIRPDELVDVSRPEFAWLKQKEGQTTHRVKAIKLRGLYSQGLLIPAPEGATEGQNLYSELGLVHWEPELHIPGMNFGTNKNVKAPPNYCDLPKYDIENARSKYRHMFIEGEIVWVQYKLNGANCSVVYTSGDLHVHSRTMWPERNEKNEFWRAVLAQPNLVKYCEEHEDTIVYGELIGLVPGYKYGLKPGEVSFRIFDMKHKDGSWFNSTDLVATCHFNDLLMAPVIGWMEYSFDKMCELAELKCPLECKVNEGIVVRPKTERWGHKYGRCIGKFINPQYLEKN